ncbi:hypothetical protein UPYG_G00043440 [Umbra pygmaea]|uniref:Uncharacterized protein n=1 Tax=Umbra pygmaea TaxID=75934 RepID=A0ABD0XQH9_UMBPY
MVKQQTRILCKQQGQFELRAMSSAEEGTSVPKLHRLFIKFDPEAVGVVAILLGVFQVLLAVPLYYMDVDLHITQLLLPLFIGLLFVLAGSFAVASEKSPSRRLLMGCAYTNVASLIAGLLALCLYSVSLNTVHGSDVPCTFKGEMYPEKCPGQYLEDFFRSITGLLIIYDLGALIVHSLISFSALKGLRFGLC